MCIYNVHITYMYIYISHLSEDDLLIFILQAPPGTLTLIVSIKELTRYDTHTHKHTHTYIYI